MVLDLHLSLYAGDAEVLKLWFLSPLVDRFDLRIKIG